MKQAKPITNEMIAKFLENYDNNPVAKVYTAAVSKADLADAAFSPADAAKLENCFSIDLHCSKATSQQASGRCWLFASMNVMREIIIKKCNLADFELSGNYFAFWDKFEKINYCLESVIDTADKPLDDRTVNWILHSGIGDGGQWDMMVSIVKKYGIVPKSVMPETYQSAHTRTLMQKLNGKLRKDALELRQIVAEGKDPSTRKEEMLAEMFNALCVCFGRPVEKFDFAYEDKEKVHHVERDLTPKSFFDKYVGLDLDNYVSVINAPTADKPFGKTYTVDYIGNVVNEPICYLNLPIDQLKALVVKQMQNGEVVWFGSDCGKYGSRNDGIWDQNSFVFDQLLGLDLSMTKEERLDACDSAMNHAMVLCGVNLDANGQPNRWKIENSWGPDAGLGGYYIASDAWFDAFTYQVIINKKYLSEEQKQALSGEAIHLHPWDPMGTLA